MRLTKAIFISILSVALLFSCGSKQEHTSKPAQTMSQKDLKNETMRAYAFLDEMYKDEYYPTHLVDKGKHILLDLCRQIEQQQPADLEALYVLTNAATEKFNALQMEFDEAGSEIETIARECIGEDFWQVAMAYGFKDADQEELIADREW